MTEAMTGELARTPVPAALHSRLAAGLLIGLICMSPEVPADEIYKIVDDEGNVTYSSEPPEQGDPTEVIQPPPEPPAEDVESALKRQQKAEEQFDKLDQARAEQARLETRQRPNTTTTVIQSNTVLGGPRRWQYGPYWGGASVAPGAPTAPGYRPPGHRPRPPVARPHPITGP